MNLDSTCNKNVFSNIELSDIYELLPKKSRKNTKYTMEDMKQIIKVFDNYLQVYNLTPVDLIEKLNNFELVIFVNTGNHWEIIYSPKIPKQTN